MENIVTASCIIDTTPFEIPRHLNFKESMIDFSPNYGMYCWKYQVIINRRNGLCCSLLGPYHGSINDITILQSSGIMEEFAANTAFLADRIYFKPTDQTFRDRVFCAYRRPFQQEIQLEFNRAFSSERVLIENFLCRLKAYKSVFAGSWRYSPDKHLCIVTIASSLVNVEIKLGRPLRSL